jgi:hypothetical protein
MSYELTFSILKKIHFRVMRCSLNVIPQTKDLLNKSRLPLGVLIHPFKDLEVKSLL